MDFVDSVLVRLADPAMRSTLFNDASLANLVEAAYDTEAMPVSAPYAPVFDEFRLGYSAPPSATIDGDWMGTDGANRTELRLRLHGLSHTPLLRIEALWRGELVVRTAPARDRVESVEVAVPSFDVDPDIVADLGSLPTDSGQLETERRIRVLARLRAGLNQPAALTEDHLDRLLVGVGAGSVGELVTQMVGQAQAGAVQIRYTAPANTPLTARPLPFAAAVLVRDAGFSLAELLVQSRLVRARTEELGLELPVAPEVRQRHRMVVIWMVPSTVFDDEDWPGGTTGTAEQKRAARFAQAGQWLANEGVGLVAVA